FYGQVDFDACEVVNRKYVPTGSGLRLPSLDTGLLSCFPTFSAGCDNSSGGAPLTERWEHPSLFNALQPAGDDRGFALSNLEALFRYGETGSPGLTSDLFRLCPANFGSAAAGARARRLVTTHSFDLARPGVTPWLWPQPNASSYQLPVGLATPVG